MSAYKQIIGTIVHFPSNRQTLYSLETAKLVYTYHTGVKLMLAHIFLTKQLIVKRQP